MDMKKSVGLHENTAMDDDIDVKSNLKALATGRLGLNEAVSIVALSDAKERVENQAADIAAAGALGGGIDVDMSENGDGNAGDEDMFESHADDSEPPKKARRVGDKGKAASSAGCLDCVCFFVIATIWNGLCVFCDVSSFSGGGAKPAKAPSVIASPAPSANTPPARVPSSSPAKARTTPAMATRPPAHVPSSSPSPPSTKLTVNTVLSGGKKKDMLAEIRTEWEKYLQAFQDDTIVLLDFSKSVTNWGRRKGVLISQSKFDDAEIAQQHFTQGFCSFKQREQHAKH